MPWVSARSVELERKRQEASRREERIIRGSDRRVAVDGLSRGMVKNQGGPRKPMSWTAPGIAPPEAKWWKKLLVFSLKFSG
jgi:hypothetical protein